MIYSLSPKLTLFCLLILSSCMLYAQDHVCGSHIMLNNTLSQSQEIRKNRARIADNHQTNYARRSNQTISIPIVVHVLYYAEIENISADQINSQLTVLNDDFNRMNADATTEWPQAASANISFELATVDPFGNTTTGITRTYINTTEYQVNLSRSLDHYSNVQMKSSSLNGIDAWPTDQYLNIWVINMQDNVKGFSTFPGSIESAYDGVVINYTFFGTIGTGNTYSQFNKGRTATHEVGHWLDLYHIWGEDCDTDDLVDDTPEQESYHFGCPSAYYSCGSNDMVNNYMDYTFDSCQNMFTQGQAERMRTTLLPNGYRSSFYNSINNKLVQSFVWYDENQNGIQDIDEEGLEDIEVVLLDDQSQIIAIKQTNEAGLALFENINMGSYYIIFNEESGLLTTVEGAGNNESLDSDITESMALKSSDLFIVDENTTTVQVDGGFFNVVLAVSGIDFTAVDEENGALISWNISEANEYAEVSLQKSLSNEFTTISTYDNTNFDHVISGTYLDGNITQDTYYRIQIIGINGDETFSKIIRYKSKLTESKIAVYPNPASDYIHISGINGSQFTQNTSVQISDLSGSTYHLELSKTDDTDDLRVNISELAKGLYFIHTGDSQTKLSHKFVKI